MNEVFYWCVALLKRWASLLNMTYEELNVWLFVIIEPIVFFILIFLLLSLYIRIRKLK